MDLNDDLHRVERVRENEDMLAQGNSMMPEHINASQSRDSRRSPIGIQSSSTNEPESSIPIESHLQHMTRGDFQEMPGFNLSARSMSQNIANQLLSSGTQGLTQGLVNNLKRLPSEVDVDSEIPRKKSRVSSENYLDSHKNIEKKRRDRINDCLRIMKTLVPDCRQYGNKKLDKAEVLEMSIDYMQRIQQQSVGKGGAGHIDLMVAQREWANDLSTWIIQNKLLYSGPSGLDNFIGSLLLHLQNFGSSQTPPPGQSPTSHHSLQQVPSSGEDDSVDPMYRQILLQQLQTSMSGQGAQTQHILRSAASIKTPVVSEGSGGQNQIQQHLQAIMMLQQQQQQLIEQCEGSPPDTHAQQQIQQLQNLQLLIAQHLTSEGMSQKLNVHQLATLLQLLQQNQVPTKSEDEVDIPSRGMVHPVAQETGDMDPLNLQSLPSEVSRDVSGAAKDEHSASVLMGLGVQEGYLAGQSGQTPEEDSAEWRLPAPSRVEAASKHPGQDIAKRQHKVLQVPSAPVP